MKKMLKVAQNNETANNGLHQTKSAVVRPLRGRSLRALFAGEPGCWAERQDSGAI